MILKLCQFLNETIVQHWQVPGKVENHCISTTGFDTSQLNFPTIYQILQLVLVDSSSENVKLGWQQVAF